MMRLFFLDGSSHSLHTHRLYEVISQPILTANGSARGAVREKPRLNNQPHRDGTATTAHGGAAAASGAAVGRRGCDGSTQDCGISSRVGVGNTRVSGLLVWLRAWRHVSSPSRCYAVSRHSHVMSRHGHVTSRHFTSRSRLVRELSRLVAV